MNLLNSLPSGLRLTGSLFGALLCCVFLVAATVRRPELPAHLSEVKPPLESPPEEIAVLPSAPQVATKQQMENGRKVYLKNCFVCHQPDGKGLPGIFPPLAKSDYLMADKDRSIRIIIAGQSGEIVVNGERYNGMMPPVPINDRQIADVLTYIRNSWGNSGSPVTVEEVRAVRAELAENTAALRLR